MKRRETDWFREQILLISNLDEDEEENLSKKSGSHVCRMSIGRDESGYGG